MNFELESWEIPPGANADDLSVPIEFGPVEWNGALTMISARSLESESGEALAFFRPHGTEINYVVTDSFGQALHWTEKRINSKTLGQLTRLGIGGGKFYCGRLFYCHGESLIFREGRGHWESQDFWQRETPLEIPFDAILEPSARVHDWLQTQWNDENSTVRISWEWNRKSEREQNRWLGTIVPRWNELHDVMRAVSCVAELPVGAHWILDHVDTHNHTPELLKRLQSWRELLQARFSFEPLPASYPEFLREYFHVASIHVQVVGHEFSAHEQLEARLYLRDWLRRNAPDYLHLIQ